MIHAECTRWCRQNVAEIVAIIFFFYIAPQTIRSIIIIIKLIIVPHDLLGISMTNALLVSDTQDLWKCDAIALRLAQAMIGSGRRLLRHYGVTKSRVTILFKPFLSYSTTTARALPAVAEKRVGKGGLISDSIFV